MNFFFFQHIYFKVKMSKIDREKVGNLNEDKEKHGESENGEKPQSKSKTYLLNILKICGAIFSTYVFIFAIGLLSHSFQVLGGSFLNEIIADSQGKIHMIC